MQPTVLHLLAVVKDAVWSDSMQLKKFMTVLASQLSCSLMQKLHVQAQEQAMYYTCITRVLRFAEVHKESIPHWDGTFFC